MAGEVASASVGRNCLLSQKRGHHHGLKLELIVLPVSDVDRAKDLGEVLRSFLDVDCAAEDQVFGVEQVDAGPAGSCGYLSNRYIGFSNCSHMTDHRDGKPGPTVNGVARTGTGAVNPR
ncbi:hypothetical protein [Streptomyces sp. NPDC058964]|uniref:hypothetical protein n=1 Tax=Streptomyces sp. NPDC058964 TaxID=3346681 RepID=UPI0036798813